MAQLPVKLVLKLSNKNCVSVHTTEWNQMKKTKSEYGNLLPSLLLYVQRQEQIQAGKQEQPRPPLSSAVTKGTSGCLASPFFLSFLSFPLSFTKGNRECLVVQGPMSESLHLVLWRQGINMAESGIYIKVE